MDPGSLDELSDEELSRLLVNLYFDEGTVLNSLSVTVDGLPLQNLPSYRAESPAFTLTDLDLFGLGDAVCEPVVADGYWILLRPLPPGEHTIHFTGVVVDPYSGLLGDADLDITYKIQVKPGG